MAILSYFLSASSGLYCPLCFLLLCAFLPFICYHIEFSLELFLGLYLRLQLMKSLLEEAMSIWIKDLDKKSEVIKFT